MLNLESNHVMKVTLSFPCYRVQEHGGEPIIPFSCALERNLADLPPEEAAKYCEQNNVQRLVQPLICRED